jgi:hypothetical protein
MTDADACACDGFAGIAVDDGDDDTPQGLRLRRRRGCLTRAAAAREARADRHADGSEERPSLSEHETHQGFFPHAPRAATRAVQALP